MMDFFTALLNSQLGDVSSPRLSPRIPALFEPIAPRVDLASFDESSSDAADGAARDEIQTDARTVTRATSQPERAPYRGVMNVPPITTTTGTVETTTSSPPSAPRASQPLDAQTDHAPTSMQELENPRASSTASREETENATRIVTQSILPPIRPAPSLEPRALEPRAESDTQNALAPQSAPIVRINIGSIIVRAMPASRERSPQRSPPPAKKLSLDDYLKNQDRGER